MEFEGEERHAVVYREGDTDISYLEHSVQASCVINLIES